MTAAELERSAAALGLDVVGAAPAVAYEETEETIRERRIGGLFADMKFTMAQPEVSCHPELLLEGRAKTVVSAALCYWVAGPEPDPAEGRLPRYAWRDHYADLRERLDALGQQLGGTYRVLVDANQHVDREGARRAGLGFYGKNTMLITREHGSWVVLGTLVTDVEIEASPPLDLDCGRCTLCIDACPTGALDDPGVLDANRCLSFWTQAPAEVPEEYREELGASVYGCDICQEVCPWNRGIEKRRAGVELKADAVPNISLGDWLTRPGPDLVAEFDRLYVPRNDARWLKRNALHALGNTGDRSSLEQVEPFRASDDPVLADAAAWAERRILERFGVTENRLDILLHELRSPVAALVAIADAYPEADEATRERLVELARAASASLERILGDVAIASLAPERVDLFRVVVDACETAALGGADVVAAVTDDMELVVVGDAVRLRQALDNLIANAIGHSPPRAPITVTGERSGSSVVVAVSDVGDGIAPGDLERIFEARVRATSARPGSGLGLAVVRTIAREHGGEVEVESSPGEGATFRLVLPGAFDAS